jgi:frataxin
MKIFFNRLKFANKNFNYLKFYYRFSETAKITFDRYITEVDNVMNFIFEKIDEKEYEITDNINLSAGVLNFTFCKNKNYVINIQRPNLQIWLSSPYSGPQRFEFNAESEKWINIRNGRSLLEILNEEINSILEENNIKDKLILKH